MHMGSDATKYQCKTFMDINTLQRKLENRESHRNQCTFEHLRDLDPLPRAYHVFEWLSNGKIARVNSQPLLHIQKGMLNILLKETEKTFDGKGQVYLSKM